MPKLPLFEIDSPNFLSLPWSSFASLASFAVKDLFAFVLIGAGCLLCAAPAITLAASTQPDAYPNRPIRFVVPFVAGAGTDTTARLIAGKLSEMWGQQVVVDNRTGATGAIGVDITAHAAPDGYTICLISASQSVNSAVNARLPYDLTKDLAGITQATSLFYAVYVNPAVPAAGVKELIAYAKANPAKLNFGSSGTGGLEHFAGELFNHMAGTRMTHVPFKGAAAVVLAILTNEVQVGFSTWMGVKPQVASGRIRLLAITAAKRSASVDAPTVAESIPGYEVNQWYGIITSAKVPRPLVGKINAGIVAALKAPDLAQRLAADGSIPVGSSPEAFDAHIKSEIAKWRKFSQDAHLVLTQ
jgi:tripartite-type tricarboxylate transporter receptor subunit TctC